jgi:glycosyltransferase involved in cell wall biosynthesis
MLAVTAPGGGIKILFFLRNDILDNPGGDLVEARHLRDGLVARGHQVTIAQPGQIDGAEWDIVHLFNIDRAAELATFLRDHDQLGRARLIISPIYSGPGSRPVPRAARAVRQELRSLSNLLRSSRRPSRYWLPGAAVAALRCRADGLVFHSEAERESFARAFPGFQQPAVVIPPPVSLPPADPHTIAPASPPYLAVVARIEPLKNQIWLLRSGLDRLLPIVFAGAANPKRPLHVQRFRRLLRQHPRATWLGAIAPAEVRALLGAAAAHVLASRREAFGLATIEALSTGCEAVVPDHHFAAAAEGPALHTFRLGDRDSLLAAVQRVLAGDRRAPRFCHQPYTPEAVATQLEEFYRRRPIRPPS